MTTPEHHYAARLTWEGNRGEGTASYAGYGRRYRVRIAGKPDLVGTADPAFHGEPQLHNPEELFLSAIAACHMLTYLALCARRGIRVVSYEDDARGTMRADGRGGGSFEEVTLLPTVIIDGDDAGDAEGDDRVALAAQLHDAAHELCYIARSCSIPIRHRATVHRATVDRATVRSASAGPTTTPAPLQGDDDR